MEGVIDFLFLTEIFYNNIWNIQINQSIKPITRLHIFYQMSKIIVDLGNKKGVGNYDSSSKLTDIHNSFLMIIVDTNEKDVSRSQGCGNPGSPSAANGPQCCFCPFQRAMAEVATKVLLKALGAPRDVGGIYLQLILGDKW